MESVPNSLLEELKSFAHENPDATNKINSLRCRYRVIVPTLPREFIPSSSQVSSHPKDYTYILGKTETTIHPRVLTWMLQNRFRSLGHDHQILPDLLVRNHGENELINASILRCTPVETPTLITTTNELDRAFTVLRTRINMSVTESLQSIFTILCISECIQMLRSVLRLGRDISDQDLINYLLTRNRVGN